MADSLSFDRLHKQEWRARVKLQCAFSMVEWVGFAGDISVPVHIHRLQFAFKIQPHKKYDAYETKYWGVIAKGN